MNSNLESQYSYIPFPPSPPWQLLKGNGTRSLEQVVDEMVMERRAIIARSAICHFCDRVAMSLVAIRPSPELWERVGGASEDSIKYLLIRACERCRPRFQLTDRIESELIRELDRRSRIVECN